MTVSELQWLDQTHDEEFLKFFRIPRERLFSNRPDLNAFILLDKLLPGTVDMVYGAEHDEIHLSPQLEDIAPVITEEQAIDLMRCGVRFEDGLRMFT